MEMQLSAWIKISNDVSVRLIVQSTTMGRRCAMEMHPVLTVAAPLKERNNLLGSEGMLSNIGCLQTVQAAQKGSWELSREKVLKLILVISYAGHICPSNFPWNIMFQTQRIPITAPSVLLPVHRDAGEAKVPALQWQLILETLEATIIKS